MPLKTPLEYRESLRDGRRNFFEGEHIEDVTRSEHFRVPLANACRDYEYDDPEFGDLRKYQTDEGEWAHRIFQVPRTVEDLHRRAELIEINSIVVNTSSVLMALLNAKDQVAKVSGQYAENIERMYRYVRDNDLRTAELISDAKGDRSRRPADQDDPDLYVRIVDRTHEGIVVRGPKLHISAAAVVHELVVLPTKTMSKGEEEYAVSFTVPANAPGVTIINKSYARADWSEFDFPWSGRRNMPEALVVFDDVFVPWDRVFLAGEVHLSGVLTHSIGLWERINGLVGMCERGRFMIGAAQLLAEYNGIAGASHIQDKITELIMYTELLRMALNEALLNHQTTESGMIYPNPLNINVGKYYGAANYHLMLRHMHDICGGLVMNMPREADFRNEELSGYLHKYLHTKQDVDVEDRAKLFNFIRDSTADAFGGWEMIATIQGGGGLQAQKLVTYRAYDLEGAKQSVRDAIGLTGANPARKRH